MGKKKDTSSDFVSWLVNWLAKLLKSKEKARLKIREQIDSLNELHKRTINTEDEDKKLTEEFKERNKINHNMLSEMFPNELFAEEYNNIYFPVKTIGKGLGWEHYCDETKRDIFYKIEYLESIIAEIESDRIPVQTIKSKLKNVIIQIKKNPKLVWGILQLLTLLLTAWWLIIKIRTHYFP